MLSRLKAGVRFANVISVIALFVALGGGAYAAIKLPKGSVSAKTIKSGAVKTGKIANGAVTTPKFSPDATAPNAARLGGALPSAFQTSSAYAENPADNSLTATAEVIATTQITTDSPRRVVAIGTATAQAPGDDFLICNVSVNGTAGPEMVQLIADSSAFANVDGAVAAQVAVEVGAGTHTVNLNCRGQAVSPDAVVQDANLSAFAVGA